MCRMEEHTPLDLAVVGAGILGLAIACEVLRRRPDWRLAVLEKEPAIARHQTGHNSGVIHSGLYYAPGSLKARLCVEGARRLREFCASRAIQVRECGKLVVATEPDELPRLEELHRRGQANGVPGLELVGPGRIGELEPHVRGLRALYSPTTAIVDFAAVAQALADDLRAAGASILTSTAVRSIERSSQGLHLRSSRGLIVARRLVTCAGLYADRLAQMTGGHAEPRIVPFRGDYVLLRADRRSLVRGLVYPVPDPAFPFLGIHATLRIDGQVWLGPNAVLAFAREGYRLTTLRPEELAGSLAWSGWWRLAARHWRTGLGELYRDVSRRAFVRAVQRYIPELGYGDVTAGPSGVRAQALSRNGNLVDDFVFDRNEGILHVRNAATSSLAIADYVGEQIVAMPP
jgi:L-2-hydroxyglutarate oxidase LhgO